MAVAVTKDDLDQRAAGKTVPSMFLETTRANPDLTALRWKDGDGWAELTYREYEEQVARATAGLESLGVGPGDRVVLMMRNRPEFLVYDVAACMLGATPISIYNSSSPEQVAYLAGHCKAKLAVVEDLFADRFEKVRDELPHLEQVVLLDDPRLRDAAPADLDAYAGRSKPDDLATVIYTSGTTGPPKGVRLTHYNIAWTIESYLAILDIKPEGFRAVSYLPMAHIAERMNTHYLALAGGYEVTTCPDPGQVAAYNVEVRPQIMFGVPRVWEKIHAGVQAAVAGDPDKARQLDEAVAAALPLQLAKRERELTEEEQQTLQFLDDVAFRQIRETIGLDACEYAVTGAAPMTVEVLEWYLAVGIPLSEIYGMSENTGPLTWEPYRIKPGTVGRAMPGCTVQLADDGEVIAKGGNIFEGYLDDPEKTADALDADGWLHTGDVGEMDDEGYLRIVDRKKELIITAGGKNISPANLEAALKTVPLIGQACAIGDKRPFVSALVVLDPDVAQAWAASHGKAGASLADLAADPDVIEEVERGVADAMAGFNNAERVKKVTILPDEWLPDSEELTPTSKLKRRGIHEKYAEEITDLYA